MKTYDDLTQLGRGTYGVVYKTASGERPIALKVSNVDEDGIPETTVREVVLLRELSGHPNILTFYDVNCPSAEKVCISTELLDMDLRACIKRHPHRLNQKVKTIAKAILAGIHHCHTNGVMHRDLKPHNILISQDLSRIKLGDFGLARYRHDPRKTLTHEVVTLWYRAPEVLLGDCCYDESIDLWSCGCVIAELLTGQPLFPGDSEIDMIFRIFLLLGTPTPKEWPKLSLEPYEVFPKFLGRGLHSMVAEPEAVSFLEQMLQVNPARRLTAAQCLRHPWLRC